MSGKREKALKSIFKGAAIVFAGNIISKIVSLLYRILVGQTGVSEYGQVSVMISVFSVGVLFSQLGIPNGVQRFVAYYLGKNEEEKAIGTFQTGIKLVTLSSFLTATLLFISAPWLANSIFNNPKLTLLIRIASIAIPFRAYAAIGMHLTNALEKMQYSTINDRIFVNIAQLVLAGILIYLGQGYLGAALAYSITFIMGGFIAIYFVYREFPKCISTRPEFTNFKEIIRHSWPLLLSGFFAKITGNIDTFMIQSFLSSKEVGLYQAAFPFATSLTIGAGMFGSIFLSNASELVSKGEQSTLRTTYRTVVKWTSITTVPMFLVIFAFPKAVLALFGQEYFAATNLLRILSVGFIANGLIGPAGQIYQATERTKLNFYTSAILGISNLVFNAILIPLIGSEGAAWASTASLSIAALVNLYIVYTVLGKQPFKLSVLKVWLAGITSISIVYVLTNYLFVYTPKWFLAIDIALLGLIYPVFILISGAIEEEDLMIMRAIREKTGVDLKRTEKLIKKFT